MNHYQKAQTYIKQVLNNEIPACQWVVAACLRHIEDLKRVKSPEWPYKFDVNAGTRVCRFLETLPHIKGPKARNGELITLEPWQCFVVTTLFGWVRKDTGYRRFRRAHIEVPRGNAKSTLSSGLALYMLLGDHEAGAEVYSAATTRDQARIVFGDAQKMCDKKRDLVRHFKISVQKHAILSRERACTFQPLSSDGRTNDGLNIHFAVLDELHAHKTKEIYEVVETGAGKRPQSLVLSITTAGFNRSGICYQNRSYLTEVLNSSLHIDPLQRYEIKGATAEDEQLFGIIYTIDDGDDWMDEASWCKANPNWAVSVEPDYVRGLARKAMQMPSAENNFKTKHLNVWVNAAQAWMDMRVWEACLDQDMTEEQFYGEPCYIGLDLASKVDLVAMMRLHTKESEGVLHYYLFGTYYLPRRQIDEGGNDSYAGWEKSLHLRVTEGDVTDFGIIQEDLIEAASLYRVEQVAFDPWQANQMAQILQGKGMNMVEYRNTVQNFSEPMKELEALARQKRIHHNGDPVLAWALSNVVCKMDKKENIFPDKERPENKIDPVVAAIMALGVAINGAEQAGRLEEFLTRGILSA